MTTLSTQTFMMHSDPPSDQSPSLALVLSLTVVATAGLLSCDHTEDGPSTPAPPDTFRQVTERYGSGAPRYVSTRVGDDSSSSSLYTRKTFSPDGVLLKVSNHQTGDIHYYHDLHPRFDSTAGLQSYLQGMWRRGKGVQRFKEFNPEDSRSFLVQIKANTVRTFKGDTLVMTRYAALHNPQSGQKIGHDIVEVGFDVDYRDPNRVLLESVLYRRRPDSAQVLADTPILPPELTGRVIDTLRIYGPDRFRIMTSASDDRPKLFERHLGLRQVPGSFPEELRRQMKE